MSTIQKAPKPTRYIFDPWNSASTGHQRAENRLAGSTSWRQSRTRKLGAQFADVSGAGGKRVADAVGAGREESECDRRAASGGWARGAQGLKRKGPRSVGGVSAPGPSDGDGRRAAKRRRVDAITERNMTSKYQQDHNDQKRHSQTTKHPPPPEPPQPSPTPSPTSHPSPTTQQTISSASTSVSLDTGFTNQPPTPTPTLPPSPTTRTTTTTTTTTVPTPKPLFTNLTFYINGSTYPTISDHKLKQLIVQHDGALALTLARRQVTHVVVGALSKEGGGAGGGLAGGKIQREVMRRGGRGAGVRYVKAGWIVECVKRGRRVGEGPWCVPEMGMGTAGAGTGGRSVREMLLGVAAGGG